MKAVIATLLMGVALLLCLCCADVDANYRKLSIEQLAKNSALRVYRSFDYCQGTYPGVANNVPKRACMVDAFTGQVTNTATFAIEFLGTPFESGPGATGIADFAIAFATNLYERHINSFVAIDILDYSVAAARTNLTVAQVQALLEEPNTDDPKEQQNGGDVETVVYSINYIDDDLTVNPPAVSPAPSADGAVVKENTITCTRYGSYKDFWVQVRITNNGQSMRARVARIYDYVTEIATLVGDECLSAYRPIPIEAIKLTTAQ